MPLTEKLSKSDRGAVGASMLTRHPNVVMWWIIALLPFVLWKIRWIWRGISWLSQKIWTFCEIIFHYIQHRVWVAIAFWSVVFGAT